MRRLPMVLLMLCVAGTAMASQTGNSGPLPPKVTVVPEPGTPGPRTGDTIADPYIVTSLPFTGVGTTVGLVNDYDEVCPYGGSLAPDAVYAYTCDGTVFSVSADLCLSSYDTKIFVYDNAWTPGDPLACNDDYWFAGPCHTYSSYVTFSTQAGHTYYICVDGYGSQSGNYDLVLLDNGDPPPTGACCAPNSSCTVTTEALCTGHWVGEDTVCVPSPCPPVDQCPWSGGDFLDEGEPPCGDNYTDNYNGGCNSTPVIWQTLLPLAGGCATVCGKSCTYGSGGGGNRDTDWYLSISAGTVTYTLLAEFPFMMALFTGTDCASLAYTYSLGDPWQTSTLTGTVTAGADVGFFAANQGYSDWPAELRYRLEVCGIQDPPPPPGACCYAAGDCIVTTLENCALLGGTFQGDPTCTPTTCVPVPTERKSWGAVKNLFRDATR